MKQNQSNHPDETPQDALLDSLRSAAFSAVPETLDAERILHAYQQAYKTEGTLRNVPPTTALEKEALRQVEQQFRSELFALSGFEGLKAAAIFCHHPKIRSSGQGDTVNFLAEVRDSLGRSLIPCDENASLVASTRGLVSLQVVARVLGHAPLLYIPTYSPRAFQHEIDACTDIPVDAPRNYLQREIARAAARCLTEEGEADPFIRDTQAVFADNSANLLLATNRGYCQVVVAHDPKTLRVSFVAHKVERETES